MQPHRQTTAEPLVDTRERPLLEFGRWACYHHEGDPAYAGNLLVEAMPPLPSSEWETYQILASVPPPRREEFFELPLGRRLEAIADLRDVYIPTPEFVDAFAFLMRAIRTGYKHRSPQSPRVARFLYRLDRQRPALLPRLTPTGGGSMGVLLVGTTGTGKTSFIDRLVQYVSPDAIIHPHIDRPSYWTQVVVFRIQAAETKTVAGIAAAIAAQADALTGSHYASQLRGRTNRGEVLVICCSILTTLMAGILIVEDLQLIRSTGGSATEILDFLANIMETTGIPVASVSTFKALRLVEAHTAVGGKLQGGGARQFLPLPFGPDFMFLIEVYWSLRITQGGKTLPDWLPPLVYVLTGGIRRVVRVLFEYLFERMAIEDVAIPNRTFVKRCATASIGKYSAAIRCLARA